MGAGIFVSHRSSMRSNRLDSRSGQIEISELNTLLRKGADVKLDGKLQVGGGGAIVVGAKNKHGLRKNVSMDGGSKGILAGVELDSKANTPIAVQVPQH